MSFLVVFIDKLADILLLLIFVRVIMSFFRQRYFSGLAQFIFNVTQPLFDLVRKIIPKTTIGMFDLTPMLAFLLIDVGRYLLITLINRI